MAEAKSKVGIIMGSQSDWSIMAHARDTLDKLGIANEVKIISAHRTPDRLSEYVSAAKGDGLQVIMALPGAAAAMTALPVLGVPMEGKVMGGLDAILSMVQMPAGIPVGTLAVGRSGAVNAGLLAASILALGDDDVAAALDKFRADQTAAVVETPKDD